MRIALQIGPISVPQKYELHYKLALADHGDLTRKLGKFVQYEINDFWLYRPGFHVPDISDSSRTVHIFDQVVTYRQQAA